jgi:prepilin-type N-terminal cleavage/methylation domain-containing protein
VFLRPGEGAQRGFTLVELIVVIVILGILAAIAVPALTGYIEKSKWTDVELSAKTQLTAIQTLVHVEMSENGLTNIGYSSAYPGITSIFGSKWYYASNQGLAFEQLTTYGQEEYTELAGNTLGLASLSGESRMLHLFTSLSGEVIAYRYIYNPYPATGVSLRIMYVKDINATDPVTVAFRADAGFNGTDPTLTSGINIYSGGVKQN